MKVTFVGNKCGPGSVGHDVALPKSDSEILIHRLGNVHDSPTIHHETSTLLLMHLPAESCRNLDSKFPVECRWFFNEQLAFRALNEMRLGMPVQ